LLALSLMKISPAQGLVGGGKMGIQLQSYLYLFHGLLIAASHEQSAGQSIVDRQRYRIQIAGTSFLGDTLLPSSYIHQVTGIPVVSARIIRVEFQGAFVFPLGGGPNSTHRFQR
jgi:hypothetical protein